MYASRDPIDGQSRRNALRKFRQRTDGDWDYFPSRFRRRGYRVDSATRDRIIEISQAAERNSWLAVFLIFASAMVLAESLKRMGVAAALPPWAALDMLMLMALAPLPLHCVKRRRIAALVKRLPASAKIIR